MKRMILKGFGILALVAIGFVSCKKDESTLVSTTDLVSSTEYTEMSVYEMQCDGALGKLGCYELVFPVTIQFSDNTTLTANSYDELKEGIKAWREANGKGSGRPEFVFPISVINEAGETIVVDSKEQLRELRAACPDSKGRGHKGHFLRGLKCFDLVFPVTLVFPDASELEVGSYEELKNATIEWRRNNPRAKNHPVIKFPFSVTLKSDGSTVTIESREDLKELKKSCRG